MAINSGFQGPVSPQFSGEDLIDIRDVFERIAELRAARAEYNEHMSDPEAFDSVGDGEAEELEALEALTDELAGRGGDHEQDGVWYPVTLINEDHFTDYTQQLAEDIGAVGKDSASWVVIDWEATARNVKVDYAQIDFDGETYWYR